MSIRSWNIRVPPRRQQMIRKLHQLSSTDFSLWSPPLSGLWPPNIWNEAVNWAVTVQIQNESLPSKLKFKAATVQRHTAFPCKVKYPPDTLPGEVTPAVKGWWSGWKYLVTRGALWLVCQMCRVNSGSPEPPANVRPVDLAVPALARVTQVRVDMRTNILIYTLWSKKITY